MVRPEIAEHEEEFMPLVVLHESLHEAQGRLGSRCAFEEIEPHQTVAADDRDHCQTKALAFRRQQRRMSR